MEHTYTLEAQLHCFWRHVPHIMQEAQIHSFLRNIFLYMHTVIHVFFVYTNIHISTFTSLYFSDLQCVFKEPLNLIRPANILECIYMHKHSFVKIRIWIILNIVVFTQCALCLYMVMIHMTHAC